MRVLPVGTPGLAFSLLLAASIPQEGRAQDHTLMGLPEGADARLGRGALFGIGFLPDGRLAAATSLGVWLYDARTGGEVGLLPGEHRDDVHDVAFSPDGRTLATSESWDPTIRLWGRGERPSEGRPGGERRRGLLRGLLTRRRDPRQRGVQQQRHPAVGAGQRPAEGHPGCWQERRLSRRLVAGRKHAGYRRPRRHPAVECRDGRARGRPGGEQVRRRLPRLVAGREDPGGPRRRRDDPVVGYRYRRVEGHHREA